MLQIGFNGAQKPPAHELPQHCASDVHLALSEMHAVFAHRPLTPHWKLQQSGPALQAWPSPAQTPTTEAHLLVLGSQTPEQQSVL